MNNNNNNFIDKFITKILSFFPKCILDIYNKHKEIWLYLIAGGLATMISISTQYLCAYVFKFNVIINTSISWICAVIFAFFMNKYIVFNNNKRSIKQAISFFLARILTYLIEVTIMYITVEILLQNEYVMKIIAQVIIIILNYILSKFIIFKRKK